MNSVMRKPGHNCPHALTKSSFAKFSIACTVLINFLILSNRNGHFQALGQNLGLSRNSGAFSFETGGRFRSENPGASDSDSSSSSLVWESLPLRSSFRPLNSVDSSATTNAGRSPPATPIVTPPNPPEVPTPPQPPSLPEALALIRGEARRPPGNSPNENNANSNNDDFFLGRDSSRSSPPSSSFLRDNLFAQPTTIVTSTTPSPVTTLAFEEDDVPTRLPMNRFRPTRPPSNDDEENTGSNPGNNNEDRPGGRLNPTSGRSNANNNFNSLSSSRNPPDQDNNSQPPSNSLADTNNNNSTSSYAINNECFECICEASTNCNAQSRCQTSDVRHTRCGLFLITYDQWLASGLSKQLVSAEALARDVAADERAYYECVISRDCAEQLLSAYMASHLVDCDKDGRLNCYDVAAIHQAGPEKCRSEAMLESQYWSDFNACYGFARR